ncbi:S8 family serine peptidase [Streptomyces sp. NPDC002133]|uniref:S8 family serine peptidase n=1 Tax=Streptomyces sp. NPDC002133 TaxID=3154409 RepID=UPI00331B9550
MGTTLIRRPHGYVASAIAIGMAVSLSSGLVGGAAAAPSSGGKGVSEGFLRSSGAQASTVTLITGDRVMVDGSGQVTGVERAKGRERIPFSVREVAGHTHVVPGDAELLLAQGKLDARLFDVTQLVADGYDDARRSDLPLIVTFRNSEAPSTNRFTGAGARFGRALHVVNGMAMEAVKKRGSEFWDAVTGAGGRGRAPSEFSASTAVEKVWLDGKRRASLDKSVPQIGAPTAWAAGYDGTGIKVAVLDTGVDKTHPDLESRVIAEQNFSESPGTGDKYGHGTHVASIVAGTGAKSGGTFKGVAPGAQILNGKVLSDFGEGSESGIIAGMEWAVAQGAEVVNLSLGGEDTSDIDLMEEAVNRLSAETDALFVVAAGNSGELGERTVNSPGSAAAALTVGAVDKNDQLADFSSRGPLIGDGGIKPDLTAPGVAITAALAPGSLFEGDAPSGTPGYVALDGTSMATPHVAGAAAILAQQHPDWDGERIKAVLTGSAEPAAYSSFQQGTGRTDVAQAMKQSVITGERSLDFGKQSWPHDDDTPVTKKLTYRNFGSEPVTLDLSVEAWSADGKPAAEAMFTVMPQRLTLPAGGEASAAVTADTRAGSADGTFGGSVSATSVDGKLRVRTAIGAEREVESYHLTLKHLDEHGAPTGDGVTNVHSHDRSFYASYADEQDGEVTVRLPKGDYTLSSGIHPLGDIAVLLQPKLRLDADTTVVVDARKAKPVQITVPDPAAKSVEARIWAGFKRGEGQRKGLYNYLFADFRDVRVGQLGAALPADEAYAHYSGNWSRDGEGAPVNYHLAWNRTGRLDGFSAAPKKKDLAKVDMLAGSPAAGRVAKLQINPVTPRGELVYTDQAEPDLPHRRTDYVLGNGIKWSYHMWMYARAEDGSEDIDSKLVSVPRTYRAGKSYTERFNIGVFGPALGDRRTEPLGENPGIARNGNTIRAYLPLFGDGSGHWGNSNYLTVDDSLQVDGKEILASSDPSPTDGGEYTVPAKDSAYKLALDTSRDPAFSPVSTRVKAEWTFRSAETPEGTWTALPLSVVRFSPDLTLAGTAKAGRQFKVPFHVEGAAAGQQPKKLAFEVSYDEGTTWQPARAVGSGHLSLKHPAKAGSVSLRAKLTDMQGNTLVQTIERAYILTQ